MLKYLLKLVIGKDNKNFEGLTFLRQTNVSDIHGEVLGEYYLDYQRKVTHFSLWFPSGQLDQDGVPFNCRPSSESGKTVSEYNPTMISQFALGNHHLYLETKQEKYLQAFISCANWVLNSKKVHSFDYHEVGAVWESPVYAPAAFAIPPWRSAMIQGQVISVLLRAYQLTRNLHNLMAARDAVVPFLYSYKEGGVSSVIENNRFYEEIAVDPPQHILNGHIYALWGLFDLYRVTRDNNIYELFQAGCESLEAVLPKYDNGYWSRYDLYSKVPALARYHQVHIAQLQILYAMTHRPLFKSMADKWRKYWNSLLSRVIYSFLFVTRLGYWRLGKNILHSKFKSKMLHIEQG